VKTTMYVIHAFLDGRAASSLRETSDGENLYVHGNRLAWWSRRGLHIHAGDRSIARNLYIFNLVLRASGLPAIQPPMSLVNQLESNLVWMGRPVHKNDVIFASWKMVHAHRFMRDATSN